MNFKTTVLSAFAAATVVFAWGEPQKFDVNIQGQEAQAAAIDALFVPLRQSIIDEQDIKSAKWRNK
ncbi:MAG: hypothetical protein N2B03_08535 [Boseongicola sp.]|jgi:hypothetical protein